MADEPFFESDTERPSTSAIEEDDEPQGSCECDVKYCTRQENTTRSDWLLNGQSTLALISVAFSTGVIDRTPHLMYIYGLGYLLSYIVMMIVFGGPLAYYELSMGQFSSNGILTCWPLPIFKCVGAGILSMNLSVVVLDSTIGAWAIYYLHVITQASINNTPLPWMSREDVLKNATECATNSFGLDEFRITPNCSELFSKDSTYDGAWTEVDGVCWSDVPVSGYPHRTGREGVGPRQYAVSITDINVVTEKLLHDPGSPNHLLFPLQPSSAMFFDCHVLKKFQETSDPWVIVTGSAVGSLIMWLLVMFIIILGIRAIGCILTVTVPLALILLVVLFVRTNTLTGAADGINRIFNTEYTTHSSASVWMMLRRAAYETLRSLAISRGILTTYGSYNRFHNNYVRDVVILGSSTIILHILGSFMVLGFVGYRAYALDVHIYEILEPDQHLIFQVMSSILSSLPRPELWCGLFYTMILLLVLHTAVALCETFVTAVLDQIPTGARKFRPLFVVGFCAAFFLIGLPLYTPSGWDLITFISWNISKHQTILIVLLMIICYTLYGTMTYFWYRHDVAAMAGWDCCCSKSIVCWMYSTCSVIVLATILLLHMIGYGLVELLWTPSPMGSMGHFGMLLRVYVVAVVVVVAVIQIVIAATKKKTPIRELFTRKWKPALRQHQKLVEKYRAQDTQSSQNYHQLQISCNRNT